MVASPDRRYTVYARDDERDITIVDADTGETEAMLSSEQPHDILWSTDFYERMSAWDAQTGQKLSELNWYARSVDLNPDGTRLAAAGTSLVTIWDVATMGD